MDVKSFIFEATDKALRVDDALKGVETAKAEVEIAKAKVETAKQAVSTAKEELETYAERAEEFGLTKSKFKDAVERMKTLLADIGAVETSVEQGDTEAKTRTPRKRKSSDTTTNGAVETTAEDKAQDDELTALQHGAEATENTPIAPSVVDDVQNVASLATSSATSLETSTYADKSESDTTEVDASDENGSEALVDNSVTEMELNEFVDELLGDDTLQHNVLTSIIKISVWYATNVQQKEVRSTPSPLTFASVLAAEDNEYLPADIKAAMAKVSEVSGEDAAALVSWFNKSVDNLADGKQVDEFVFPSHEIDKHQEQAEVEAEPAEQASVIDEVAQAFAVANVEDTSSLTSVHLFDDNEEHEGEDEVSYAPESEMEEEDALASGEENIQQSPIEQPDAPAAPKVARPSWLENRR